MSGFDEECLTRYFLGPGGLGPIGSVYVADADLLDMFSTEDPTLARRIMLRSLPHASIIKAWLSGEIRPKAGRTPEYVGILAFLCWMQTTETRIGGERDFRVLLGAQLGDGFRGADLSGLNPMWEHFRDFLRREHGVELVLPGILPHRQIGRTLRIAFPTWRDRDRMRRIRASLPTELLLDPLTVANRIRTSASGDNDAMQSFDYNFRKFDIARQRGGRDYAETPFWRAWYPIVAEQAACERLEVTEGAFGEHELFRVSPLGERTWISTPEDGLKFIPRPLRKLVRDGIVFLQDLGFGKFLAVSLPSNILLMRRAKLEECDPQAISSVFALNVDWVVAKFRRRIDLPPQRGGPPREFGWRGGIRIGSAYLGRTPLAPMIIGPAPEAIRVERDGEPIEMVRLDDGLAFPDGVHSGSMMARALGETREIRLVSSANEIGADRRLALDLEREVPDDEFHCGTVPALSNGIECWNGPRTPPCSELVTIGEALYARSSRGLSFSEAIEIVTKGMPFEERPSGWDVLQGFADAGWLEMTLLRHFPARRILQRPPTAERVGTDIVRIGGATPIAVVKRLEAAAGAVGAHVETWDGSSRWALPRYVVRCPDRSACEEFLERMALAVPPVPQPARIETRAADDGGVHGYGVIGKFDEDKGYFAVRYVADGVGLYRLARAGSNSPFLYRSVVAGTPAQNYVSPNVAILSHHMRSGGPLFLHGGGYLRSAKPRARLPSSWARWASDRTLCNAAPALVDGEWRYQYAVDAFSLAAIRRLVRVEEFGVSSGLQWIDAFVASASNRNRAIHDARSGRTRIARGPVGKR